MKWLMQPWVKLRGGAACPNMSSRLGCAVDTIVLHYTAGGSLESAYSWFFNPAAQASAHFIIDRDGTTLQVVPLDQRAWHVGQGRIEVGGKMLVEAVDRSAVGIEMVNFGLLHDAQGEFFYEIGSEVRKYDVKKFGDPQQATLNFGASPTQDLSVQGYWQPYPAAQLAAVARLCATLVAEFKIPLQRIVGHEDVAFPVGRKTDPGPLFDWRAFMDLVKSKDQALPEDLWKLHRTVR